MLLAVEWRQKMKPVPTKWSLINTRRIFNHAAILLHFNRRILHNITIRFITYLHHFCKISENWKSASHDQFQAVLNFVWASSTTLMQVRMVSAALRDQKIRVRVFPFLHFSSVAFHYCAKQLCCASSSWIHWLFDWSKAIAGSQCLPS